MLLSKLFGKKSSEECVSSGSNKESNSKNAISKSFEKSSQNDSGNDIGSDMIYKKSGKFRTAWNEPGIDGQQSQPAPSSSEISPKVTTSYYITRGKVPSSSKNQASCASSEGIKKEAKKKASSKQSQQEWPAVNLEDFLIQKPRAHQVGWDIAGLSDEQISALEQDILFPLDITGFLIAGQKKIR